MCGFLGAFAPPIRPFAPGEPASFASAFSRLAHRGNTSSGQKLDPHSALFHYRLAFRDLAEGKQPLTDSLGRATILFNGELYDFRALREELSRAYEFRTRSDTEVILAAYLVLGDAFLARLDGEFAFVIHDHRSGRVLAARDSFGVKPLFFTADSLQATPSLRTFASHYAIALGGRLFFASEIKGLPVNLRWDARGLDRLFLSLYEEMGTSYENVFALAPGSLLEAYPEGDGWRTSIVRMTEKRRRPCREKAGSFAEASERLRSLLRKTVADKLDSEVPLGAYLSGGIDSRIAAFEMSRAGAQIDTFTVGFEGADFDETAEVSRFLAGYKNLHGRALRTTNAALEYSYPHAIYASELVQPYTNGAAKWWLSRFARRHVQGVLTGDGADELFCGYPSYRYLAWWQFYRRHPGAGRAALYEARVVGRREKFWEKGLSSRLDGSDLDASVNALGWAHPLFAQVQSLGHLWAGDHFASLLARERPDLLSYVQPDLGKSPLVQWQNYFLHTHFPSHVLNWVGDRMEMANTLEGRPIFLSQAALRFALELPDGYLVRGLRDKAVLRKAYAQELGAFAAAPKKQFNAPFLLAGLAQEFLSDQALRASGLVDPALVAAAKKLRAETPDALERSFADIFLQNCLVAQMQDRYLVRRQPPERDLAFEERFLDEHTVNL